MGYGWLNIGSLLLGLVAWTLPIINFFKRNSFNNRNCYALSIVSISACAISLSMQLFVVNHLVQIWDWTALLDTLDTIVVIALILVIVTIVLNGIVWIKNGREINYES